jgi:transcriptional regulator with XRE-family HTH domain
MKPLNDDPVVARRRLKSELKVARKRARRTQQDVAREMDWSTAKLIRIEGGEARISQNDLKVLLDYYDVKDEDVRKTLLSLATQARAADPWSEVRDLASPAVRRFWSFEASASVIRNYQPLLVPGLLQSEQYTRTVLRQLAGVSDHVADRLLPVRSWRQQLHDRQQPPQMHFILDEAVVRRCVGGSCLMHQQLRALLDTAQAPHVTIQVIPFTTGAHRGLRLPRFVHLSYQSPADEDILFLEGPDEFLGENPDQTRSYLDSFREMQTLAASPAASADLIANAARRLGDDRGSSRI